MNNDLEIWHNLKSYLNENKKNKFFHEREIWFLHCGKNIGYEQDGKGKFFLRPALIFKKFNLKIFLGLPTTTKTKFGKFFFKINCEKFSTNIILSQIKLFSSKRLYKKIGKINEENYKKIIYKFKKLIT